MANRDLLFFCSMCKNKTDEQLDALDCTIPHKIKHFKKGDYIAYQGDTVSDLVMLTHGQVKTEIVSDSGFTLPMQEITAPYPLAAAFLFADDNRFPVDVIAIKDCELIYITKKAVEEQIARCPGFLRGFMAFNANRMKTISDRIKIFAQKGIKAKVAYYILSLEKKGSFEFDRSIAALAEYFTVERPSLSRAISELVSENIITFKNGKGDIINAKALHEILL